MAYAVFQEWRIDPKNLWDPRVSMSLGHPWKGGIGVAASPLRDPMVLGGKIGLRSGEEEPHASLPYSLQRRCTMRTVVTVALAFVRGPVGLGAETVVVLDPRREGPIRAALGKAEGDLTVSDLESLTVLEAPGRESADLTGLEHAANLKRLALLDNRVSDLSPLAGLSALEELSIGWNRVGGLSLLSGLSRLKAVGVSFNEIEDLTSNLSGWMSC